MSEETEVKKEITEDTAEKPVKKKRGRPPKAASETKTPIRRRRKKDWASLIECVDQELIVDYDINSDFTEIEAIRHKNFGVGVIIKILDDNKMEVVFEENKKVLVQNWE